MKRKVFGKIKQCKFKMYSLKLNYCLQTFAAVTMSRKYYFYSLSTKYLSLEILRRNILWKGENECFGGNQKVTLKVETITHNKI